jgi:hypothetical protein
MICSITSSISRWVSDDNIRMSVLSDKIIVKYHFHISYIELQLSILLRTALLASLMASGTLSTITFFCF